MRRNHRKGSTMVEAALTLPIFLVFLFSLVDFGYVLFAHQTLVHQARAAARYGAVNPGDLGAIKNLVLYNQTTGSGFGVLGLQPDSVSVTRTGQGTTDDRLVITISNFQFTRITPGWAGHYIAKPITVSITVEN